MSKTKNFCCICMQKSKTLISLNSVDDSNVDYMTKLCFCVPKQTWKHIYQVCNSCTSQIDIAYSFIHCCLESETFRREELDRDKSFIKIAGKIEESSFQIVTRETKFTCDHCNKSFSQKKYLCQHIKRLHLNRKNKEGSRKTFKKEEGQDKIVKELLPQESSSSGQGGEVKSEKIVNEDICVKEEDVLEYTEFFLENDIVDRKQNVGIEVVKSDPSDTEDLEETTDAGNDDDYEQSSAESEVDHDLIKLDKKSGKKRGPKREPQKCSFCDEIFQKRHEWATHIRTKHTFQKPFSCDLCDAKYMNGYSLLIHKRKHTNEKPFICATCGKSFVSSADLNHHNKIHDADRAYPCPMCDRSFKTHSNLRTHRMQMHLDPADWKFPCHLCEKKFPIRGNLVKHLKRHAGIKEFDCHVCNKRFVNKAELTLHLNTHTNQRLFKCQLCGKDYKNREGLRRHMKVVHDQGNWKAPKSEKKHLCPMCPKIFAFVNKLQRHIYTHTGEKPFKCDYCQKRFIDNYGRKVHYKKDHNIVDFHSL